MAGVVEFECINKAKLQEMNNRRLKRKERIVIVGNVKNRVRNLKNYLRLLRNL